MDSFIESIRAAVAPDATLAARAKGANACRTILATLGETARVEPGPVAVAIASLIRSAPPDQLLDMAIAKLRALAPADTQPTAPMFNLQRVRIPTQ